MLNSKLEALPCQIRAKSLAYTVVVVVVVVAAAAAAAAAAAIPKSQELEILALEFIGWDLRGKKCL